LCGLRDEIVCAALCVACCVGCTTIGSELRSAHGLYKDARYEEALLWLNELQAETPEMAPPELVRFYYLRGMTAFRLGQREDALHYLVLAEQLSADQPDLLPEAWRPVMQRTLQEITPTSASPHARNPFRPDTF
jgi:tetratricopeptide (TPR) repeat protein